MAFSPISDTYTVINSLHKDDGFDTFVDSISPPTTQQGVDTFLIWICDT